MPATRTRTTGGPQRGGTKAGSCGTGRAAGQRYLQTTATLRAKAGAEGPARAAPGNRIGSRRRGRMYDKGSSIGHIYLRGHMEG